MFKKISQGVKNYKTNIKGMKFSEVLDYTWYYYKAWLWGILGAAVIVAIVITGIININTKVIISGVTVNVDLHLDGIDYISTDYYNARKTHGRERVDFNVLYMYDKGTTDNIESTYDTIQSVLAQVSARELDYCLTDEIGFEFLIGQEVFMDLRECFSESELEKWGNRVIYAELEGSGKQVPVAIDLQDLDFFQKNATIINREVYYCLTVNTPHKEACRDFLSYLQNYK